MLQPASSSLHAHINEVGKASAGAAAATTKTEKPSSFFSPQPVKKVVTSASASQNKQFRRFTEQQILEQSQSQKANPKLAKSIFLGSIERARTAALHTSLPITNDDPM
jgi:hypothetical protein